MTTKKALRARGDAGLFLTPATAHLPREKESQRRKKACGLVNAIVGGQRVLLHEPQPELESGIELRIRVALAGQGIIVWKHTILSCHKCRTRPRKQTGLGRSCADLICIVPPLGRFLAIEVKRPQCKNAKRDEHQRRWARVVRSHGGVAGVATNEAEALALLEEARRPCALLAKAMRAIHGAAS